MSNTRDVQLILKAKDDASKAILDAKKALQDLEEVQKKVAASAGGLDKEFNSMAAALSALDTAAKKGGLSKVSEEVAKAKAAYKRLKADVSGAEREVRRLSDAAVKAAVEEDKLAAKLAKAADSARREGETLRKLSEAHRKVEADSRKAAQDAKRQETEVRKISRALAGQRDSLAKAEERWQKYTEQILATDRPTKRMISAQRTAADAVRKYSSSVAGLTEKQRRAEQAVEQAKAAYAGMTERVRQSAVAVKEQEAAVEAAKQAERQLGEAVRAAAGQYASLNSALAKARTNLRSNSEALREAKAGMAEMSSAAREVSEEYARVAESLRVSMGKIIDRQHRAALEAKRAWKGAEADVKKYAKELREAGGANDEIAAKLAKARAAAKNAKDEYNLVRGSVHKMRQEMRASSGSVSSLRTAFSRLVAEERRVSEEARRLREREIQVDVAQRRVAESASRAATGIRRMGFAFKKLNHDSRTSLSLLQRIRGQLLAIAASYAGVFALFRGAGEMIEVQRQWDAAVRSIGVAINSLDMARVGKEMDYVRGVADKFGVSIQSSVKQFSRLGVATRGTKITFAETKEIFEAVSGAARVMNLSAEQTDRVFTAIVQIASKGKVQMEELRQQLGDNLPGAIRMMAKAAGYGADQMDAFYAAIQHGDVSAKMLVKFARELKEEFGPQLQQAMRSNAAEFQRMKNAWFETVLAFNKAGALEALTRLFRKLTEVMKSADFKAFVAKFSHVVAVVIDGLTAMADNWKTVGSIVAMVAGIKMVSAIGKLASVMMGLRPALKILSSLISARGGLMALGSAAVTGARGMGIMASAIGLAGRALMAMGPYGWAAVAVLGALYAGYKLWTRGAKEAGAATESASGKLKRAVAEQQQAMEHAKVAAAKAEEARRRLAAASEAQAEAMRKVRSAGVDSAQATKALEEATRAQEAAARAAAAAGDESAAAAQRAAQAAEGVKTASAEAKEAAANAAQGIGQLRSEASEPIVAQVKVDDRGMAQIEASRQAMEGLRRQSVTVQAALTDLFGSLAGPAERAAQALNGFVHVADVAVTSLSALASATPGTALAETAQSAGAAAEAFERAAPASERMATAFQGLREAAAGLPEAFSGIAQAAAGVGANLREGAAASRETAQAVVEMSRALAAANQGLREYAVAVRGVTRPAHDLSVALIDLADAIKALKTGKDILRELAAAMREAALAFGTFVEKLLTAVSALRDVVPAMQGFAVAAERARAASVSMAKGVASSISAMQAATRQSAYLSSQLGRLAAAYHRAAAAARSLAAASRRARSRAGTAHTGGIVKHGPIGGNPMRDVPEEVFAGAPRYHTGGIAGLRPDEVPVILRTGEEVITPNDPRHRNNMPRAGLMQGGRYSGVSDFSSQIQQAVRGVVSADRQAMREFFMTVVEAAKEFRRIIESAAGLLTGGGGGGGGSLDLGTGAGDYGTGAGGDYGTDDYGSGSGYKGYSRDKLMDLFGPMAFNKDGSVNKPWVDFQMQLMKSPSWTPYKSQRRFQLPSMTGSLESTGGIYGSGKASDAAWDAWGQSIKPGYGPYDNGKGGWSDPYAHLYGSAGGGEGVDEAKARQKEEESAQKAYEKSLKDLQDTIDKGKSFGGGGSGGSGKGSGKGAGGKASGGYDDGGKVTPDRPLGDSDPWLPPKPKGGPGSGGRSGGGGRGRASGGGGRASGGGGGGGGSGSGDGGCPPAASETLLQWACGDNEGCRAHFAKVNADARNQCLQRHNRAPDAKPDPHPGRNVPGGIGSVYHQGGIVGQTPVPSRPVPFDFSAMRFHSGGFPGLQQDEVQAILQKGEEVLPRDDPRNALNAAGKSGVKIVNTFDAQSFLSEALSSAEGEEAIINAVRANAGAIKEAMEV